MKRLTQVVILLLVTTFLPVLILFSFPAGGGHASALKSKPTPTPSPTATPSPTPPSDGIWTLTGSLLIARYGIFTATLLPNGQVLVAGGLQVGTGTVLAEAELYTPSTGKWTTTGSMNVAHGAETTRLLSNGQVLVAGGADYNWNALASAELYTPSTGKWTTTGSMHVARYYHTATLLQNGQVLVVGGNSTGPSGYTASAELYAL
jgi:N-acetylneuraminic acid mutarotase